MKRRRIIDPRRAFPAEVVALHDEQGIPWPTWYAGSLDLSTPETVESALRELATARQAADGDAR